MKVGLKCKNFSIDGSKLNVFAKKIFGQNRWVKKLNVFGKKKFWTGKGLFYGRLIILEVNLPSKRGENNFFEP